MNDQENVIPKPSPREEPPVQTLEYGTGANDPWRLVARVAAGISIGMGSIYLLSNALWLASNIVGPIASIGIDDYLIVAGESVVELTLIVCGVAAWRWRNWGRIGLIWGGVGGIVMLLITGALHLIAVRNYAQMPFTPIVRLLWAGYNMVALAPDFALPLLLVFVMNRSEVKRLFVR